MPGLVSANDHAPKRGSDVGVAALGRVLGHALRLPGAGRRLSRAKNYSAI
jgi:hypothetical protein